MIGKTKTQPKADAPNAAMSHRFHSDHHGRGVGEPRRWRRSDIMLHRHSNANIRLLGSVVCLAAVVAATHAAAPSLQPLVQPGEWPAPPGGNANDVEVVQNHAYIALGGSGLAVIDVSNPTNPVHVGGATIGMNPIPPNKFPGTANGVAVAGNFAYVAYGLAGLQVFDVSNPTNCVRVGGFVTNGEADSVVVSGNYAYVANYYGFGEGAGLHVIDVRNPTNCVRVGGYYQPFAYSVAVSGSYAYVAVDESGLSVIDVSNPTNCVQVGHYADGGEVGGVAVSGNYAYLAAGRSLQVIDVSNVTNCLRVGGYGFTGYTGGLAVWGRYAYVTDGYGGPWLGARGVHVIDVSNPTNCVRVAGYYTSGEASAVRVAAGRIYVADGLAGLLVLPTLRNLQFTVRVDATPGVPFTVEAATNLNTSIHWAPISTTNVATMPFDYVDFDVKAADNPQKFYRVRQP